MSNLYYFLFASVFTYLILNIHTYKGKSVYLFTFVLFFLKDFFDVLMLWSVKNISEGRVGFIVALQK